MVNKNFEKLLSSSCKSFYSNYFGIEDRIIFILLFILAALSLLYSSYNQIVNNYQGNHYLPTFGFYLIPFFVFSTMVGLFSKTQAPKIASFFRGYGIILLTLCIFGLTANTIQLTPFKTIDTTLIAIDSWFGFSTPGIMNWTYQHLNLANFLNLCYDSLPYEVFLTPWLLVLIGNKKQFDKYACACLISWLIGTSIYYFFPTIGPASALSDSFFNPSQFNTILKFNEIHQYQPVTTLDGGLIVFPSFHVIWAALIIYAFNNYRFYISIPIWIVNILIIASTVLLGRHYAIDVVGGIIISFFSIGLTLRLFNQKGLKRNSNSRRKRRKLLSVI